MLFADATQITSEQGGEMYAAWANDNHSVERKQFWYVYRDMHGNERYVVIDNRNYDFFMECFKTPEAANAWLRGLGVMEAYELDKWLVENL